MNSAAEPCRAAVAASGSPYPAGARRAAGRDAGYGPGVALGAQLGPGPGRGRGLHRPAVHLLLPGLARRRRVMHLDRLDQLHRGHHRPRQQVPAQRVLHGDAVGVGHDPRLPGARVHGPGDGQHHQRGHRPGVIVPAQGHRAQDEHRDDQPGPPQHHRPGGPEHLPAAARAWVNRAHASHCMAARARAHTGLGHAHYPAVPGVGGGGISTVIWSVPGTGPVTARRPAGPPLARPARPPWRVSTICYAVFAGYAAMVAVFSGPGQDRGWAVWAVAGYTAALLLSRRRGAGRAGALAASAVGALAGPARQWIYRSPARAKRGRLKAPPEAQGQRRCADRDRPGRSGRCPWPPPSSG